MVICIVVLQVLNLDVELDDSQGHEGVKSALANGKPVLATELTKREFAETLSMQPNSVFVTQIFKLADKDNNGTISLREFLDVLVIFSAGKFNVVITCFSLQHHV